MSVWRGGACSGSARSAAGDERCVSRSSANDKHLCLISVIGMEGPDKSHQVTGSKERETDWELEPLRETVPEQELYAARDSELFAE